MACKAWAGARRPVFRAPLASMAAVRWPPSSITGAPARIIVCHERHFGDCACATGLGHGPLRLACVQRSTALLCGARCAAQCAAGRDAGAGPSGHGSAGLSDLFGDDRYLWRHALQCGAKIGRWRQQQAPDRPELTDAAASAVLPRGQPRRPCCPHLGRCQSGCDAGGRDGATKPEPTQP